MNEDKSKLSSGSDSSKPIESGQARLEKLLLRAEGLKMDAGRRLRYAQLFVRAQDHHAGEGASAEHTRRARAHIIGEMHDFSGGYYEPEEAIRREHRGRETCQQFCKLVEAVVQAIRKAEALLDKHPDHFTKGLRVNYPRKSVTEKRMFFSRLAADANPRKTFYQREEPMRKFASVRQLVLISWRHSVPDYEGKWQDMYALARVWHISNSTDIEYFRRYVTRITG